MLIKLAIGGIRARIRDYVVLLSGLVVSSAIFYMFMALATNKEFLRGNSPISITPIVFGFGEFLLVIITTVYIIYANTFLMSIRRRDYAVFMMLGAKSSKIAQLIIVETISVGLLSSVVGTVFGIGLTKLAGRFLLDMLHVSLKSFSSFWAPAVLTTFGFFILIFLLAAVVNAIILLRTPMIKLLHADKTPNRIHQRKWLLIVKALVALALIATGYISMTMLSRFGVKAIGIALFTIVIGTYFLFSSLLVWLIDLLKRNKKFADKGLHTFTLSQLSFRIRDYTKILTVVTMLFALALGAITIGLGFKNEIDSLASKQTAYDVVTVSPDGITNKFSSRLTNVYDKRVYSQKLDKHYIYFNSQELSAAPLEFRSYQRNGNGVRTVRLDKSNWDKYSESISDQLLQFRLPKDGSRKFKVITPEHFFSINAPTRIVKTYKVKSFGDNYATISKIVAYQNKKYHISSTIGSDVSGQKLSVYNIINDLYGGLAFMGFFLGIAFLAMLASTLMFKILSGASYDSARYLMLQKIGVNQRLLRISIREEIGLLFVFPGMIGIAHVLFGLQLFKKMLTGIYGNLLIPFGTFLIMYGFYYVITVWIYEKIVIKNKLASDK